MENNQRIIEKSTNLYKLVVECQKKLDTLILLTPTGKERNKLCDLNIEAL